MYIYEYIYIYIGNWTAQRSVPQAWEWTGRQCVREDGQRAPRPHEEPEISGGHVGQGQAGDDDDDDDDDDDVFVCVFYIKVKQVMMMMMMMCLCVCFMHRSSRWCPMYISCVCV